MGNTIKLIFNINEPEPEPEPEPELKKPKLKRQVSNVDNYIDFTNNKLDNNFIYPKMEIIKPFIITPANKSNPIKIPKKIKRQEPHLTTVHL